MHNCMDMPDWSHMQIFLAVYRSGSISDAARLLNIDQSTVTRRLSTLEAHVGRPLFSRSKTGTHPTPLASQWLPLAERVEAAMREAAVLAMADEEVSGLVRIALPENLADFVVAPRVEALLERFPGLQLALDSNIAFADLTRLGADIALRFSPPESGDVLTRRIGTTRFGVYGHRELVQRFAGAALEDLPWIGWHAPLAALPEARWLSKVVGATPRVGCSKATTIVSLVRNRAGVALLPHRFASIFEELSVFPSQGVKFPEVDVWLARPALTKDVTRVEVVAEWLATLVLDLPES